MEPAQRTASDSLKGDYLAAEHTCHHEKECLLRVISTFGLVVDRAPEFRDNFRAIKRLLQSDTDLPTDDILQVTTAMRNRIFAEEMKSQEDTRKKDPKKGEPQLLREACKTLNKITLNLTERFYPFNGTTQPVYTSPPPKFQQGMTPHAFQHAADKLFTFVDQLKNRILTDLQANNDTFLSFYKQINELEKVLVQEFHEDEPGKSFESFEQEIQNDVETIVDSFDACNTLKEVKNAVVVRLSHIKDMLAERSRNEKEKSQKTQQTIAQLQQKISQTKTQVQTLSIKVNHFKEKANRDGLSGLFNRKAFDMRVAKAIEAFNQGGSSFLLVMFDVDDFKKINDTYGHVAGDKIIQKIGTMLNRSFRKDEFIARYGGDEFAVVIEGLTEATACKRIENFKKSFGKLRFFSKGGGDIPISISAGIAAVSKGDRPEDLIHKADVAMYEVKKRRKVNA